MSRRVLIAGATGAVGARLMTAALAAGIPARGLARRSNAVQTDWVQADATQAEAIRGCCSGIDTVVSALGASVAVNNVETRSYLHVDVAANRNLIAEASRAGVRRFVYVAAHVADGYSDTAYIRAHEMVVESLRAMPFAGGTTVVRPTGIFSACTTSSTWRAAGLAW